MSNNVVAVFPLALVKSSLHMRSSKYADYALMDLFGYIRAKRMAPAVRYSGDDLSFVHCGRLPLVGRAWVFAYARVGSAGRSCYINTAGEHVYPA